MTGLLAGLQADARLLARSVAFSAAFGFAGIVLLVAGLVCLTAALWIAIALFHGTMVAFVTLGLIYCGLGALFLALSMRRPRGTVYPPPPVAAAPPRAPLVQIAEAFAIGMEAGRAARGPRR